MSVGEAEQEQYDRQIRLWGIEAQRLMKDARVLVHGLSGMHAEVIKNLVLTGVSVTVEDDRLVTLDDLSSNYFLRDSDIGMTRSSAARQRIQELNGFIEVYSGDRSIDDLSDEYISKFQVVLVTDCMERQARRVSDICRAANISFFWSSTFGLEGCFFLDLGTDYGYFEELKKNEMRLSFPTLQSALSMTWNKLVTKKSPLSVTYVKFRVFETFRNTYGRLPTVSDSHTIHEIAKNLLLDNNVVEAYIGGSDVDVPNSWSSFLPVCSVLGGILSQEVIKVTTKVGAPMRNFFVYSLHDFCGRCFLLDSSLN